MGFWSVSEMALNRTPFQRVGFADLYRFARGASILDIGCKRGQICFEFAAHGASYVYGIDNNPHNTVIAKAIFADVSSCSHVFECADVLKLNFEPFANRSFDIVLLLATYHKLKRQDAIRAPQLVARLGQIAKRFFVWGGYLAEMPEIEAALGDDFNLVQQSSLNLPPDEIHTIWQRR